MKRSTTSVLTVTLMLLLAAPALAHDPERPLDDKSAAWWSRVGEQLVLGMQAPIDQIRRENMQNIIFFASNYSDKLDFAEVVPSLMQVYKFETVEADRILALAALHTIGEATGSSRLAELLEQEKSERLRRMALAVIANYRQSQTS